MAWRIFGKDLLLLWPWAVITAAVQFGLAGLMLVVDRNPDQPYLLLAARLFVVVVFLVNVSVIGRAVHQDPIPGARQDWLVRPIRRLDLLLGKLLFVLAVVQLPMLAADLAGALVRGFSWAQAAEAAVSRNLFFLLTISLPAFGIAALTRNPAEFTGAGMAYFIVTLAATLILSSVARIGGEEQATNPLAWTGVAWISRLAASTVVALGMLLAIGLLYFRRKVVLARSIVPVFVLLAAAATLTPWGWLFAAQETASAEPALGHAIGIGFDPSAPRRRLEPGQNPDAYVLGAAQVQLRGRSAEDIGAENRARRAQGDVTVFIPLRVTGLAPGALLWADRSTITLTGEGGRVLFRGRGEPLQVGQGPSAYHAVRLPALVFEAIRDRPVDLRADYSLTLFRPRPTVRLAALGGEGELAGVGRCATRRDSDGDDIALQCLQSGRAPSCVAATLEDPASGRRNPETLICAPDYSPYPGRGFPDALARFEVEAPFRDRLGLAAYPVGAPELTRAQIALTVFDPQAHFTRRITVAGFRPGDWTAQPSGRAA